MYSTYEGPGTCYPGKHLIFHKFIRQSLLAIFIKLKTMFPKIQILN